MKRWFAALVALALLAALALTALAEGDKLYVNRDSLKIYTSMDKNSKVLIKLKGGTEVRVEGVYDGWHGVYYTDKSGAQQLGYAQSKYLAERMPQSYCSHSWTEWTVTVAATCTEGGSTMRECPVCGKTQTKEVKKLGHDYSDWTETVEPTCDAPGEKTRVCARCGRTETRAVDPLPHEFGKWTLLEEATCTTPGRQSHECEECGFVEEVETDFAPHTFGSWVMLAEPTCTSTGQRVRWCVVCGFREPQTLNMLPHEYGAWTVTRQASCTAAGERARQCVLCGTRQTEAIDPLPHTFSGWSVTRAASCTQAGQQTRTCQVCGTVENQSIPMLAHSYGWVTTVAATDHSAGTRAYRCAVCGREDRQESFDPEGTLRKGARGPEVRALQQLLADQGYLSAGGVDGSYGGGTERAVIQFQKDQGLEPDGVLWPQTQQRLHHVFGDWQAVTPLGRSVDGVYRRVCVDCGYEERATLKAGKAIERRQRGEDVRVVQTMLNEQGFNCGTADGAYGPKLDSAYAAFAAMNNRGFAEGKLEPEDVDALLNGWIAELPAARWRGQSAKDSPVRLILTLTPAGESMGGAATYEWKLTNMGSERCRVYAVLLGFGDGHDFGANNLVLAVDGTVLARDGGNSASGSFSASADWGEGAMHFCAVGVSEKTGEVWLSNVRAF